MKNIISFLLCFLFVYLVRGYSQTCGTTNLALNRNVFASAGPTWAPPANLVDGTVFTNAWGAEVAGTQWAYVALDKSYNICRVVVKWTMWNYADFKIQGTNTDPSTGTATWTDLASVVNGSGYPPTQTFT